LQTPPKERTKISTSLIKSGEGQGGGGTIGHFMNCLLPPSPPFSLLFGVKPTLTNK